MTQQGIIQEVVRIILKHAHPSRIYLYGSRAAGEEKRTSDFDIAYFDEKFKDNTLIQSEVEKISTLYKIDVTNLAMCEERFRNRVMATGKVLYSASKKLRMQDSIYNFSRALARFSDALRREKELTDSGFQDIYLDIIVKRFEFTYEMAWKAIKRYLDFAGIPCSTPRACFKEAFAQGLVMGEEIWLEMIEMRNLTSHVYDESEAKELLEKARVYEDAFSDLKENLSRRMSEDS